MSWPDLTDLLTASGYCSVQRALTKKVPGISQPIQHIDDPPYADAAAVGRPGLAGMVDGAGLEMRGLHRIGRRLARPTRSRTSRSPRRRIFLPFGHVNRLVISSCSMSGLAA